MKFYNPHANPQNWVYLDNDELRSAVAAYIKAKSGRSLALNELSVADEPLGSETFDDIDEGSRYCGMCFQCSSPPPATKKKPPRRKR